MRAESLHWEKTFVSKLFCHFAWDFRYLKNYSEVLLCCKQNPQKSLFDARQWDVNHPVLKSIRKEFLSGSLPSFCSHCKSVEGTGGQSHRLKYFNDLYGDSNQLDSKTSEDGSFSGPVGTFIDFRPGNTCNLACMMCHPDSSSSYHDYEKIMNQSLSDTRLVVEKVTFDSIAHLFDQCQTLYLSGEEPTVMKECDEVLQQLVKSKRSSKVHLIMNTNATIFPKKWNTYWDKIKQVTIVASLDGIGAINDYIRYPSNFETISKNLQSYQKLSTFFEHVQMHFEITVFALNVFYISDTILFLQQHFPHSKVSLNFLSQPSNFSIDQIPSELAKKTLDKLEKLVAHHVSSEDIQTLVKRLEQSNGELSYLSQVVQRHDLYRGTSFHKTFSEISRFFS